jgi:hypothetical protein
VGKNVQEHMELMKEAKTQKKKHRSHANGCRGNAVDEEPEGTVSSPWGRLQASCNGLRPGGWHKEGRTAHWVYKLATDYRRMTSFLNLTLFIVTPHLRRFASAPFAVCHRFASVVHQQINLVTSYPFSLVVHHAKHVGYTTVTGKART